MDSDKNMQHVTIHKAKKPWYKRFWVWALVVIVLIGVFGSTATNTANPPSSTAEQAPPLWDIDKAYDGIKDGMTKAEVEQVTGKASDNCTEHENTYLGRTEYCHYGNAFAEGSIDVTFSEGRVSSKTKTKY